MRPFKNSTGLDPNERLTELASIFAAAIMRLRARAALVTESLSEIEETCLEVRSATVLSDHHG